MHIPQSAISDFHVIPPRYESLQSNTLDWISISHAKSKSLIEKKLDNSEEIIAFQKNIKQRLCTVGCKPDAIYKRGHEIADFMHTQWQEMLIYRLEEFPEGVSLEIRQKLHQEFVEQIFERFYDKIDSPPEDLIHTSCTGYASPSGAQKLAAKKQWWDKTTITHLYHMGCYASIPALRLASAFISQGRKQTDIVHTELCTLHNNPSLHDADQLVAQSLFADGFIKYSVVPEKMAQSSKKPYLKILGIHEQIIPNSSEVMAWNLTNWGFRFILAKEIPSLIAGQLQSYLKALCLKANVDEQEIIDKGIFAIHPGGPKILRSAQLLFGIHDYQIQASKDILYQHGNMSSATLPHIWDSICKDSKVPNGTKILSLAFGPGLTIAGTVLEKLGE